MGCAHTCKHKEKGTSICQKYGMLHTSYYIDFRQSTDIHIYTTDIMGQQYIKILKQIYTFTYSSYYDNI